MPLALVAAPSCHNVWCCKPCPKIRCLAQVALSRAPTNPQCRGGFELGMVLCHNPLHCTETDKDRPTHPHGKIRLGMFFKAFETTTQPISPSIWPKITSVCWKKPHIIAPSYAAAVEQANLEMPVKHAKLEKRRQGSAFLDSFVDKIVWENQRTVFYEELKLMKMAKKCFNLDVWKIVNAWPFSPLFSSSLGYFLRKHGSVVHWLMRLHRPAFIMLNDALH